jgi:hypothetical protein
MQEGFVGKPTQLAAAARRLRLTDASTGEIRSKKNPAVAIKDTKACQPNSSTGKSPFQSQYRETYTATSRHR